MKKRLFLFLTIILLIFGTQAVSAVEPGTGLAEPEVIDLPHSELPKEVARETATGAVRATESEWDKYTNYYYYNQLDDSKKAAWDDLRAICETYASGEKDVPNFYTNPNTGEVMGYLEPVTFSEFLSKEELKQFWCMYVYANPQYYFLKNSFLQTTTKDDGTYNGLALVVYDAFWDGADRATATAAVKNQLAVWQAEIDKCATDEAKLQTIQDIICAKVTYYHEAAAGQVDEKLSFSQSPYSVICLDKTVCAGYADTFSMLCNASGIDAISVTSEGHQWNKARVNDSWYNFDLTWDDTNTESAGRSAYLYFGRSDAMYDTDLGYNVEVNITNHQEETYWEPYLPVCSLDATPDDAFSAPGNFATGMVAVETPQIAVSYEDEEIGVSLSTATNGAKIYYTVDGTRPSVADTKSLIYNGSFTVEPDTQVTAIAALDTYTDSEVATKMVELEAYPITYVLDGGVNHADNPATYNIQDAFTLQNPSKAGYNFIGWFEDIEGENRITGISAGTTGARFFYALWSPISYAVVYEGNGATDGNVAAQNDCEYDTAFTLAENNYERIGYSFAGWNTRADGNGDSYADRASVSNLTVVDGAEVTLYAQWSPIAYTISYSSNGADDGSMSLQSGCKYDTSYTLATNNYVKAGFKFVSWNTAADGSGTPYADKASVKNLSATNGEEVALYAQWTPITYNIAFHKNGATGGTMSALSECIYDITYKLTKNSYVREGYLFAGWNTEADGTGTPYADAASVKNLSVTDGEEVALYAQWTPITYNISFVGNSATDGSMSGQSSCTYDVSYVLAANNYAKTGYKFAGWNTEADGSGTSYEDKASVKNLSATDGAEVALYAQWTPITYSLIFDGNGATSGVVTNRNCKYDTSYVLAANNYKKTGYTFTGWNTAADGSGISYEDKVSVKNLADSDGAEVTLYAQWRENTYKITFDGNGAESGEMISLAPCNYTTAYILSENVYEKTGYTFAGWNTKADGSGVSYADKGTVEKLTAVDKGEACLYAQWTPITYTITFDGNGAESGMVADMTGCEYDGTYTLTPNAFVKKWNAFTGWNTEADGSGTSYEDKAAVKNLTAEDGASVTLYAQWMMTTYHIAFDGNGATAGSMEMLSDCKYDYEYVLAANNYKKTGYKFAGWNTKADGSGVSYGDKAAVINLTNKDDETVILYAQWSPITYKIAYNGNGATSGKMSVQTGCKYNASYMLSAVAYKRTGYTFNGWNTKADGTGKAYANKASVKNLSATDGAVVTLYAQWRANTYTIKYNGNNATSGKMSAQTLRLYGKSYTLSKNAFKRTGYKFTGWNTKKNGKGTSYKNRASVRNLTSVNGKTVTLYAQWKANKYIVKFHGNGATSGSMKKMTNCSYGKKYRLTTNKFKKKGYKFVGWNTKKNGKGKMYKNKAKIKNLTPKNGKTITLYAQWKKIK